MQIRLLTNEYDSDQLYQDFVENTITLNADYVSDEQVTISTAPNFPIYLAKEYGEFANFKDAILTIKNHYINEDRDIHLNKRFWYSLLCLYKREYIVETYPKVLESKKEFENIVLKKFDWENYIYKCVLAAEYLTDADFGTSQEELAFIERIYNNLDVYNYIIKYNIFRNSVFLNNFLTIIEEENLSAIFKKKITNRPDLGKDERYGRRVIFELNKNYPIVMAPFLEKEELKEEMISALKLYVDSW